MPPDLQGPSGSPDGLLIFDASCAEAAPEGAAPAPDIEHLRARLQPQAHLVSSMWREGE